VCKSRVFLFIKINRNFKIYCKTKIKKKKIKNKSNFYIFTNNDKIILFKLTMKNILHIILAFSMLLINFKTKKS